MYFVIIWLVIFVVLIIVEMMTMGLTTIWFATGAFAAAVFAIFGVPLWGQLVVFTIVSLLSLLLMRPLAAKWLNTKDHATNMDAVIGKTARVTSDINNLEEKGSAILNGLEWTARSADNELLEEGTVVVVREVQGVKLIVSKKTD